MMSRMTAARDDRVLPFTRVLAWIIVPVLVVAFVVLWPVPTHTERRFAWHIEPTMTPMVLASAYLGGAYFFARAGLSRSWHTVKGGFPPVATFASLLGIATILHWDKFIHTSPAFWLWAGLYFTTPFLVGYAFVSNRRTEPSPPGDERLIPPTAAGVLAGVGVLALVTGLFLFVVPSVAIRVWPWMLTPLTARVMGAVFCLGLAGIGALVDRRWSSARIPLQVGIVMLVLLVVSGVRAHSEFQFGRPLTWAFVIGFPLLLIVLVIFYIAMERRRD